MPLQVRIIQLDAIEEQFIVSSVKLTARVDSASPAQQIIKETVNIPSKAGKDKVANSFTYVFENEVIDFEFDNNKPSKVSFQVNLYGNVLNDKNISIYEGVGIFRVSIPVLENIGSLLHCPLMLDAGEFEIGRLTYSVQFHDLLVPKENTQEISEEAVEQQDADEIDQIANDLLQTSENVDNAGGPNKEEVRVKKKKRVKRKIPAPSWVMDIDGSKTIPNKTCDLLESLNSLGKLTLRVHSVICSGQGAPTPSEQGILRISMQPLPGKEITAKSVISTAGADKDGPAVSPTSNDLADTITGTFLDCTDTQIPTQFDFAQKAVDLKLSYGEIRSKMFRDGACPRVNFVFQVFITHISMRCFMKPHPLS